MEKIYTGICPLRVVVDDITAISGRTLEDLQCGDLVVKETIEDGKALHHCYIVSHRQATGMCLTYADASCVETVSYDKVDGVWTYNSTDITPIGE